MITRRGLLGSLTAALTRSRPKGAPVGNSWSNTLTTSLTLPTGALPPTPRIVEDGLSDTILMYGAGGALIASIAATAGTDGLGNSYPAGISSTGGVVSQSIILVYSGTPALGNLIASIAGQAASDSFGNPYPAGITSFDNVGGLFTNMASGLISSGFITGSGADLADAGLLLAPGAGRIELASGIIASPSPTNDRARFELFAGRPAQGTGALGPLALLHDTVATSLVDLGITGSLVQYDNTLSPVTEQVPAYNTNWSDSTTFNGSANWGPLRFEKVAIDMVRIGGAFKAGAVAPGAAIFQLPAGYRPAKQWPLVCERNNGGTLTTGFMAAVTTAGNVDIITQTGGGIAANNEYLIPPTLFPLGNLP